MSSQDNIIRIEPLTIARLFHTVSFIEPQDTKITTKTLDLVSEYIRLFTSEAINRANESRLEEQKTDDNRFNVRQETSENDEITVNGVVVDEHLNDTILDTRHLEAIAGMLVLDF